ncbi:hypothetical protein O9929_17125 [Vibrio lentus]|nr:hypothetical protein [Vibrio lentus]
MKQDLAGRGLFALDNTQRAVTMAFSETELGIFWQVFWPPNIRQNSYAQNCGRQSVG